MTTPGSRTFGSNPSPEYDLRATDNLGSWRVSFPAGNCFSLPKISARIPTLLFPEIPYYLFINGSASNVRLFRLFVAVILKLRIFTAFNLWIIILKSTCLRGGTGSLVARRKRLCPPFTALTCSKRHRRRDGSAEKRECVLSVATSALNEAANVAEFLMQTCRALAELGIPGEIIFVDDGSSDATGKIASDFAVDHPEVPIHILRHWRPRGLAAAIQDAASAARGRYVCFLPADLESSPLEDIPKLLRAMDSETDVVLGRRVGRGDGKRIASGVYNFLNAVFFGVRVRDGNWIKMIRRECLRGIHLRNDWHPFLVPILAHSGCRIKEVDTVWYVRKYGRSKFGFNRFARAASAALFGQISLNFWHATDVVLFRHRCLDDCDWNCAAGLVVFRKYARCAPFYCAADVLRWLLCCWMAQYHDGTRGRYSKSPIRSD